MPAGAVLDQPDFRLLPAGPVAGQSPEEVLRGFLVASASVEPGRPVARSFLTPAAAAAWRDNVGVTVYDPSPASGFGIQTGEDAVTLRARQIAVISPKGAWSVADGSLADRYRLEQVRGQWRLARVPDGVRLTRADVDRAYRAVDVHFLAPSGSALVPERRFLPVARDTLLPEMVDALLAGPSDWLAPAVRTAVPEGTVLRTPPVVDSGVVAIDLSVAATRIPPASRPALSAQLVWTLKQLPEVANLRLFVDGQPLEVPGANELQGRGDWVSYDPGGLRLDEPGYFLANDQLRRAAEPDEDVPDLTAPSELVPGFDSPDRAGLTSVAIQPDTDRLAGLRPAAQDRTELVVAEPNRPLRPLLRDERLSSLSFSDSAVWMVRGGALIAVPLDGRPLVEVEVPQLPELGQVRLARLSRDGTRIAVAVGPSSSARLYVGRVIHDGGRPRVEQLRPAAPDLIDVTGVAWASGRQVAVLARPGKSAAPAPWLVEVDGSEVTAFVTTGLPEDPLTALAAAPGAPVSTPGPDGSALPAVRLLVTADDKEIYRLVGSSWESVGEGRAPVYPG